jgi:hypothetical protein
MCEPPFVDSCCSMLSCGGGGSRISTAFAPTALGALSAELFTEPRSPAAAVAAGSCVLRRLRALLSQLSPPAPATATPPLGVTICPRHVTTAALGDSLGVMLLQGVEGMRSMSGAGH